ncbi:hypothetical protein CCR85_09880 [Rhodothalassium salexigens]|uniref:efflux transporter outer membrane subunit n=1 Tax=Rhodothalassium salexigens TaxID=1086 RepID=UPI0019113DAC|nr:TolC family protein [Rhodothalassium salexigens]MBK5911795.1 hypothetical protein [Rhodothalassium salexigens]MBK5920353.1 hypothetical protein [Rhodothalassium salexigens]
MTRPLFAHAMRRGAALALVAALGACTLGPDRPDLDDALVNRPDIQDDFAEAGDAGRFADAPVPEHWWRLYDDPVLDRLIERALAANTDLQVARAHVRQAQAVLDQVEDARLPQTEVSGAAAYGRLSAQELMQSEAMDATYFYGVQGGLSYKLDLFGQVERAIQAAEADTAARRAAYDQVKINIIAATTQAYLQGCALARQIAVEEALHDAHGAMTEAMARLEQAGRADRTAVERAEVAEARGHAALPVLAARRQAALYRLAALLGATPAALPAEAARCTAPPRPARLVPVGDGRALLARRPDLRQAEARLNAATARIGVAKAALYPDIHLGVSGGSVGLMQDALASETLKFSLGPLIRWEFPNRGLARARIRDAEARADAAYAAFDGAVLIALRDVETALNAYARALDRHRTLRAAQRHAHALLADQRRLQQAGRTNAVDLLRARQASLRADMDVARSDEAVLAAQVRLFLTLGGGWS